MQPELEAGSHPEVASSAPYRPEEVRARLGVHAQEFALGGDDLSSQQTIYGKTVLSHEETGAPSERDASDTDRSGIAEARRKAVSAHRSRVFARGQTRLGPRSACFHVDFEPLHL
jgi:hypothetical protein